MQQVNVLIVDDEEEILEILTFHMETSLKCKVFFALNGQEAIALLNQQEIDLIICDYNMPIKNGGDVYKHILDSNSTCKYVMCSSDLPTEHEVFKDRSSFFGFIEKPYMDQGIKAIVARFKEEKDFITASDGLAYSPIAIKLLFNLSIMPSDVFIKIAENNYVKVFGKGDLYDESDYIKFVKKKILKLYVMNVSVLVLIDLIQNRITDISKAQNSETKLDSVMQIQDIFAATFKEYGLQPSFIPLIKIHFQETLELCKADKSLNIVVDKLLNNRDSYLTKHSFLLAAINIAIATEMEWISGLTSRKLVISALFHDVFLPMSFTNEMEWFKENEKNEEFLSHSQKASELLDMIPGIPPEAVRIILEHHEVGEDRGFPKNMDASKTAPLSQLFIFSHYLVDIILKIHDKGPIDVVEIYQKMETISNRSQKYGKFYLCLKKMNLFR